jgi:hypothetical protein
LTGRSRGAAAPGSRDSFFHGGNETGFFFQIVSHLF